MKNLAILIGIMAATALSALAQTDRIGTRQWKVQEVEGIRVPNSSRAYLELQAGESRFAGHTGCNSMFGAVDIRGRRIDFINVGTTRMACVEPRARRIETTLVRALRNADRYRLMGNTLELFTRNRLVARLSAPVKRDPVESIGLEDRKWTLEAIKGVPTSRLGRTAFISFDPAKGSAGGNSSCNVFGGSYAATGSTLKIFDVVSTMRACVEDERMAIEREFLDGLRQTNRYEIDGNKLKLSRNNRLLLTLNGEPK